MKIIKKISSIFLLLTLCFSSVLIVYADGDRNFCIEHKYGDMYFNGNVNFVKRNGVFMSNVTYFGNISGPDKNLSILSIDSNYNYYRSDNDEVGTLMISSKSKHNGNLVKKYVSGNHQLSMKQFYDYLSKINVDLQFGTVSNYTSLSFTLS